MPELPYSAGKAVEREAADHVAVDHKCRRRRQHSHPDVSGCVMGSRKNLLVVTMCLLEAASPRAFDG